MQYGLCWLEFHIHALAICLHTVGTYLIALIFMIQNINNSPPNLKT